MVRTKSLSTATENVRRPNYHRPVYGSPTSPRLKQESLAIVPTIRHIPNNRDHPSIYRLSRSRKQIGQKCGDPFPTSGSVDAKQTTDILHHQKYGRKNLVRCWLSTKIISMMGLVHNWRDCQSHSAN
ncbi:hypothetical protein BC938DRAFT_481266 [Jimgerdemannia flammicorona]|uniref:Uncharacterized protein n=1 Tax=Jimgerdemannia flammicorona TaxID=994334 RepID=A0A433QGP2_9FUNG|nr:hypothetical protein BC938DRAFT_481266 [Jimgerdemannia flammicorona]